jgi:hypothetical protein
MKRYPLVVFLLGLLIGGIGPAALVGNIASTIAPLPTSDWDSRPCHTHSGPQACNGIWPHAPDTYSKPLPESGLCVSGIKKTQDLRDDHQQRIGTLSLWSGSLCHTVFGSLKTYINTYTTMSVDLVAVPFEDGGNHPVVHSQERDGYHPVIHYTNTVYTGAGSLIWTPMLYRPHIPYVCGSISVARATYHTCVIDLQLPKPFS